MSNPVASPKIFGIGFQKTATTTLCTAFRLLGYKMEGGSKHLIPSLRRGDLAPTFEVADRNEAFDDNPWPLIYPELDARYPGSKFILTVRDEKEWLQSVVNHLGFGPDPMQKLVYGVGFPVGFEDVFIERYRRHNREVQAYFADRPKDLLVVDFCAGAGWEELCTFLQRDIPDEPFPHSFKGTYTPSKSRSRRVVSKVIHGLRRVVGRDGTVTWQA
ncbi:sulfotransferase family protein [uncultured Shimia sp.]|uniref:sulfotransferase family protein n=1 Tax=uncultured Shimia sp. TaxID=573152 RepID=UPI00260E6128|nr:sulfotransferase family protein [uncultured Shimia sp.]